MVKCWQSDHRIDLPAVAQRLSLAYGGPVFHASGKAGRGGKRLRGGASLAMRRTGRVGTSLARFQWFARRNWK
jgi:hypothetical protein